jgi:hypothetical protein
LIPHHLAQLVSIRKGRLMRVQVRKRCGSTVSGDCED